MKMTVKQQPERASGRDHVPTAKTRTGIGSELTGLAETALITLWARAEETRHPNPLFLDAKAVEIVERINYDFEKFRNSWKTQTSVAIRTWILDREISKHINKYPDTLVLNLGAGLDDRFNRIDNGSINWYDLDLKPVIDMKKDFFDESERYRWIGKSVLDFSWSEEINTGHRPVTIIAEGLLMYLEASEIISLFEKLTGHYPGAHLFIELLAPAAVGSVYHDTDNITDIGFKWSLLKSRDLEAMHHKLSYLEEWCVLDFFRERWDWIGNCADIPLFRNYFGEKIVHLKIR